MDYETQANQADMYDSYDFNPHEPAFTKPARNVEEQKARLMTDKKLAEEIKWIKNNKKTDEQICDFLADAMLEMQMSTAMARQVLAIIPVKMNEYLASMLEEGEAKGF